MTVPESPRRVIVVSAAWEATWPLVAESLHATWSGTGPVAVVRADAQSWATVGEVVRTAGFDTSQVVHVASLGVPMAPGDLEYLPSLREVALSPRSGYGSGLTEELKAVFAAEGIQIGRAHV